MQPNSNRIHSVLVVYRNDTKLREVNIESSSITIGSSPDQSEAVEIVLGRVTVSDKSIHPIHPNHAKLDFADGHAQLTNIASVGEITFSGGILIQPGESQKLAHNAEFRIGDHRFSLKQPVSSPPPSASSECSPAAADQQTTPTDSDPSAIPMSSDPENAQTPALSAPPTAVVPPEALATPNAEVVAKPSEASEPCISLPNGMVGTLYSVKLPDLKVSELKNLSVKIPEEVGLSFQCDDDAIVICGTPTANGDHVLTVQYDLPDLPSRFGRFGLFVNPNPRSMWKNLPSDVNAPYQKEPTDRHRIVDGDSVLVAASVRGRSHAHEGTFRDDDFLLDIRDGWHLIVVSDGAGSAKFSRQGSKIACEAARDQIYARISLLDDLLRSQPETEIQNSSKAEIKSALYNILGNAGKAVFEAISAEAKSKQHELDAKINDYAATIVYTIYKKFSFGWFVAAFAIGDGGIAIYDEVQEVKVLNKPDGGEYAGQTRFATMSHIWESEPEITSRIQVSVVERFTAIIAMTDGVSDPKFGTDKKFFTTEVWHDLWADLADAVDFQSESCDESLLNWLDFWSTGNHDDRTIAIGLVNNG